MKSQREIWINKLEELILELASQGKEYSHVYSDMKTQTDAFLRGDTASNVILHSEVKHEGITIDRCITQPPLRIFSGVGLGDTVRVLSTVISPPEKLRIKLTQAVAIYNETNGVNHIYESHKDEYGIKFKRVG